MVTLKFSSETRRTDGRRLAVVFALALLLSFGWSFASPHQTFAAASHGDLLDAPARHLDAHLTADDPFGNLTTGINNLAKNIAKIATPIATLAIVFALIMQLAGGFLPELLTQHKGFIMRALVIVVVIGFIPQLVTALSSIGASAVAGQ